MSHEFTSTRTRNSRISIRLTTLPQKIVPIVLACSLCLTFASSFVPCQSIRINRFHHAAEADTSSTCIKMMRREMIGVITSALVLTGGATAASSAETVGKDPNCYGAACLGVWDGLLADCPHGKLLGIGSGCAASQDDTPGVFAEPWDYSDSSNLDWEVQMRLLLSSIQLVSSKRGDQVETVLQSGRYLRVMFTDGKTGEQSIGEFYFTPDDTTVQFRVGSSTNASYSSLRNLERCEAIRKQSRFVKLPVLRNRKRALFFVESSFDTFGPGSAALGPPAEMRTGELEGRQDVDPRRKIDFVQSFPFK